MSQNEYTFPNAASIRKTLNSVNFLNYPQEIQRIMNHFVSLIGGDTLDSQAILETWIFTMEELIEPTARKQADMYFRFLLYAILKNSPILNEVIGALAKNEYSSTLRKPHP